MRRTLLSARPSPAVFRALGGQQPRRTFAAASPAVPSKEQAHPIGPFYEAIMSTPAPLPKEKPETPPVTAKTAPEPQQSKPAAEEKQAAEEQTAASEDKKPAKRARKTNNNNNSKAKSVPSSTSSSSSSSSSSSCSSSPSSVDFTPTSTSPSTPGPTLFPQSPQSPSQPGEESSSGQEPPSNNNDVQTRASVVFAPSLAGPAERREQRLAQARAQSRLVAGVLVPPRPEEPDNCCMSGCVNCVWDRYRDEMEEWAALRAEAERRLAAQEAGPQVAVTEESMQRATPTPAGRRQMMDLGVHDEVADRGAAAATPAATITSMDDDGAGSVGNWDDRGKAAGKLADDFWDDELYKNVPVGIREFMKHEKRLKEKHRREGALGG